MTVETAGVVPELTLGWRLRMAMESADLDQKEWATYLGVDRSSITRWTHDRGPVARSHLIAVSLRSGVPLEWIESGAVPSGNGPEGNLYTPTDSNREPADLEHYRLITLSEPVLLAA